MPIGYQVQTTEINNTIGALGRDFFGVYLRSRAFSQRLSLYTDEDLGAIGFSPDDVAALRRFATFSDTLCGVFDGSVALPQATNFLASVSAIIGVGV